MFEEAGKLNEGQFRLAASAATSGRGSPIYLIETMNSIHVIAPYKYLEMWVFDDEKVGLTQEPFVSGADTMIDRVVANIPDAEHGFILLFSKEPFPGASLQLNWIRPESNGNWYYSKELNIEGWLCPALFKYFAEAPKELFIQIKRKSRAALEAGDEQIS